MEWLRISVVVAAVAVCANIAEAQWGFQPQNRGRTRLEGAARRVE